MPTSVRLWDLNSWSGVCTLKAVDKWRHYLEGNSFVIKTNHESLRFLSQQRLQWPMALGSLLVYLLLLVVVD